jgi:hypothetical protein
MDNLSSHKRASVSKRIEAIGATLRFLPPYSTDFNPIQKAFSRLKAMLRKAGKRTVRGLWDLIGRLIDIFQPGECANYFSSCGYDPALTENALTAIRRKPNKLAKFDVNLAAEIGKQAPLRP